MYLLELSYTDTGSYTYGRYTKGYHFMSYKSDSMGREMIASILISSGFEEEQIEMLISGDREVSNIHEYMGNSTEVNKILRIDSSNEFYKTVLESYIKFVKINNYEMDTSDNFYDECIFTYYEEERFISGDVLNSGNMGFFYNMELMREYSLCFNPMVNLIK